MTKNGVKSLADLAGYARDRMERSARRNDPVAAAYWADTARYAEGNLRWRFDAELLKERARDAVAMAALFWKEGDFMGAALAYSRAKWKVIIGRNLGFRMPAHETHVSLGWLRALTGKKVLLPAEVEE